MSALARKLATRLVEMGELDTEEFDIETAQIHRLRPGYWQRKEGVWSWVLEVQKNENNGLMWSVAGSQWTATECAKSEKWDIWYNGFDKSIIPTTKEEQ
jgi:hypothetical protein